MSVLVVPLTRLGVVAPRLRDSQVDLVLGVINRRKVFSGLGFNEVTQIGEFSITQDCVVNRRFVALIWPSFLALDKANLFLG